MFEKLYLSFVVLYVNSCLFSFTLERAYGNLLNTSLCYLFHMLYRWTFLRPRRLTVRTRCVGSTLCKRQLSIRRVRIWLSDQACLPEEGNAAYLCDCKIDLSIIYTCLFWCQHECLKITANRKCLLAALFGIWQILWFLGQDHQ